MSKHAELIERLRKQCANTNGRSIEQVLDDFIGNMDEAADALEAQAREIEGLRKDAGLWISTAQAELDGVETDDANNCLKAALGALEKSMAVVRGKQGAPHG